MLAVTYKELNKEGLIHIPFSEDRIEQAKRKADYLYREGYLNVKIVEMEEKVLYTPGGN